MAASAVLLLRAEESPVRCDPWPRCDLLPAFRLDIDARARLAVRPIDVLFAVVVAVGREQGVGWS